MWFITEIAVHPIWQWLPELTTTLKFCTSLIGFSVALSLLLRRIRRWRQRRSRQHPARVESRTSSHADPN
jgi:hypothetical protein